jgi:hypothetical protein
VLVNLEMPTSGNGNKTIVDLKAIRNVVPTGDGIDYSIFLMTRVREETPRIGPGPAR